jgi:hypothetical protein
VHLARVKLTLIEHFEVRLPAAIWIYDYVERPAHAVFVEARESVSSQTAPGPDTRR